MGGQGRNLPHLRSCSSISRVWPVAYVALIIAARTLLRDSGMPYLEFGTEIGLGTGLVLLWMLVARTREKSAKQTAHAFTCLLSRRSVERVVLALFVLSCVEYYLVPMPKIQEVPLPLVAGAHALLWVSPLLLGSVVWNRWLR